MSRKIFSIDIRDDGISGLLIKNSIKGNWIDFQRYIPFPEQEETSEKTGHNLSETLKELFAEVDFIGTEFIVSISPKFVSYRNVQVPFKDRKKINQVLPFELEPTLLFPVEELTVDFHTVRQSDKTDILVSIIKNSELHEIINALKSNDANPSIIAPGGFASVLCYSRIPDAESDFIFVDASDEYTTVFVVASGQVHIARSFYTDVTDTQLRIRRLSQNTLQLIAAFGSLFPTDFEPSKIVFSGFENSDEDICDEVSNMLEIPAKIIDISRDINLDINLSEGITLEPSRMNHSLGLASAEILGINTVNFYGERSIVKKYWDEYKNEFITTGFIAAFIIIIAMFEILFDAHFLQKEVNQINRQITTVFQSTFPDVKKIIDPLQQMRVRVQKEKEKNLFTGEIKDEMLNIDILNEISTRIPYELDVEIARFVRGDDSLLVSGNTDTFNNVDDIKNRLERVEGFRAITISSANLEKSTNRIQFKLKIDL